MANQKLTALTSIPAIDRTADIIYVVDVSAGTSNKVTPNFLLGITGAPLGTTDSATVSNKILDNSNTLTVKDTGLIVQDDGDTTKQFKFQASGITTSTTRTYTVPNFDATFATLAGTETFTNKTLTSPTINTATIANPTLTVNTIGEFTASNGVTVSGLNIKSGALNTANSVVTTNITDAAVTPAKLLAGTGASWGWQSWTPTLTNLSGGTINYAKYIQIGKTVHFRFKYTLAGAGVSGLPRMTLPVTANADYAAVDTYHFTGQFQDATGFIWVILSYMASTTAIDLGYLNTSANLASTSSTTPFTWAVSDTIKISGTYEAL